MARLSRREFMEKTAAAGAAGLLASHASRLFANPLGWPIGSQVYPTRALLKDFPAYVKMMAGIGVTRLELCSPIGYKGEFAVLANGKEVRTILADHGMKAESSHFTLAELRNAQQQSIEWAREVGITQMVTATLADGNGGNAPTLDQVKRAVEEYNGIAAAAAKAGMQQGLHNDRCVRLGERRRAPHARHAGWQGRRRRAVPGERGRDGPVQARQHHAGRAGADPRASH